ncbi:unnamed protein product [Cuscuta epithymum]|uniref:Uncharacterized protein n=1 Tax=Cuscuta epithymum TaxID=186058 RepID=A0AAV0D7K5_9ASTE|nr:unnamed protein product [Cuscuta epithymum]
MAVDCSHTPLLAFVQSKQAIGSGVSLPDSESSSRLIVIHFLVLKLSEHSQHWSTLVVLCIVLHLRQLCSDHFFSLAMFSSHFLHSRIHTALLLPERQGRKSNSSYGTFLYEDSSNIFNPTCEIWSLSLSPANSRAYDFPGLTV